MKRVLVFALLGVLQGAGAARGAIIPFDLQGKTGPGLLSANETHTVFGNPGSGGEGPGGIAFDTATRGLSIDIRWGSGNAFLNLTGDAIYGGHVHGPTLSDAPASFSQDAGILIALDSQPGWNGNASAGGFIGTVTLAPGNVSDLLGGRLYIN